MDFKKQHIKTSVVDIRVAESEFLAEYSLDDFCCCLDFRA